MAGASGSGRSAPVTRSTGIADSPGELVSRGRAAASGGDRRRRAAPSRSPAGIRYGELATLLHAEGLALHNLASLPHISVAGACATGTHGSGDGNGNLATACPALELVDRRRRAGAVEPRGRPGDLPGAVVALGASAWSPRLTLDVRAHLRDPAVRLRRPAAGRGRRPTSTRSSPAAYSVSLFTDWSGPRRQPGVAQAARRRAATHGAAGWAPRWPTARATRCPACRPSTAPSSSACPGRGTPGCRTSGWSSPRAAARSCSRSIFVPRERGGRGAATPSTRSATWSRRCCRSREIRTIAADDLWLSPSYRPRQRRRPLHLGRRRRRRRAGDGRRRGAAGAAAAPAALGEAVQAYGRRW